MRVRRSERKDYVLVWGLGSRALDDDFEFVIASGKGVFPFTKSFLLRIGHTLLC